MKLERVQQGTARTIHATFTLDGVAADPDPDSALVTLTRESDGEILGPFNAYDQGEGAFSHTLSPGDTAALDTFTASWAVTYGGYAQTITTRAEVVGGFVFTLADARAVAGISAQLNDQTYRVSTASILQARTEVEMALEHELGFALVPRFTSETLRGDGSRELLLRWPHVRRVRSVSVSGAAYSVGDLANVAAGATGCLYSPLGWTPGRYDNVVVGYEHGRDVLPARAKDVALALVKRALLGAPADDRATSMSTDEQQTTFYVPGAGEPFDVPAANRFVASQTLRVGLA